MGKDDIQPEEPPYSYQCNVVVTFAKLGHKLIYLYETSRNLCSHRDFMWLFQNNAKRKDERIIDTNFCLNKALNVAQLDSCTVFCVAYICFKMSVSFPVLDQFVSVAPEKLAALVSLNYHFEN